MAATHKSIRTSSERFSIESTDDFIEHIRQDVYEEGRGVTPFLGSGVSAPSGILMGREFTGFLFYTVKQVLSHGWNIAQSGWPKYPSASEVDAAALDLLRELIKLHVRYSRDGDVTKSETTRKLRELDLTDNRPGPFKLWQFSELLRELGEGNGNGAGAGVTAIPTASPTSRDVVTETGILSLRDWRRTLEFLAKVKVDDSRPSPAMPLVLVGERDTSIIDSFNVHITRGKRPNLTHKMMAQLARPMRSRILLTTNFDTLLEEAYREACAPIQVIEVSDRGGLPPLSTVELQDSLIKLHGGMLETRADLSLDTPPSTQDLANFFEYLRGPRSLRQKPGAMTNVLRARNLLVVGYSGSDIRCVQMIKHVLDHDPDFRVYWICHSEDDVTKIANVFPEIAYASNDEAGVRGQRIILTQTHRPDLLLFELYQRLTLSLPAAGFSYQFDDNSPPRKIGKENILNGPKRGKLVEAIVNWCRALPFERKDCLPDFIFASPSKFENVLLVDGSTHVAHAAGDACEELVRLRYEAVWLELDQYESPILAMHAFLEIVALRLNLLQLEHVTLLPSTALENFQEYKRLLDEAIHPITEATHKEITDFEAYVHATLEPTLRCHLGSLRRYFGIESANHNPWVLFLYGRNGPGACAGPLGAPWNSSDYVALKLLLKLFGEQGFKCIYLPYTEARKSQHEERQVRLQEVANWRSDAKFAANSALQVKHDTYQAAFNPEWAVADKHGRMVLNEHGAVDPYAGWIAMEHVERWVEKLNAQDLDAVYLWDAYDEKLRYRHAFSGDIPKLPDVVSNAIQWATEPSLEERAAEERFGFHPQDRLEFLYHITLFRRPVPESALIHEATLRCPSRFNTSENDNDLIRHDTVRKWMTHLQEHGLFMSKPGGLTWMFSDVRLGLRHALDTMQFPSDPNQATLFDFFGQIRSGVHTSIAIWYVRVFCSTGHYLPFMEALHHFAEAIRFAPSLAGGATSNDRMRPQLLRQRLRSVSIVAAMIKLVALARPNLKFWLAGRGGMRIFHEFASKSWMEKVFVPAVQPRGQNKTTRQRSLDRENRIFRAMVTELCSLGHSLDAEGGMIGKKTLRPFVMAPGYVEQLGQLVRDEHVPAESYCDPSDFGQPHPACSEIGAIDELAQGIEPKLSMIIDKDWAQSSDVEQERKLLKQWRNAVLTKFSSDQPRISLIARRLSELAYLFVRKAKLEWHANQDGGKASEVKVDFCLVQVCVICRLTEDICDVLHPSLLAIELDCRIQVHTLYGLALGSLRRFYEAHRRLDEATALLSKTADGLDSGNGAIIQLRRAEVYLHQVEKDCNPAKTGPSTYNLRKTAALLDDAWACLESARFVMAGKNQSALWWGRLIALELRCFKMLGTIAICNLPTKTFPKEHPPLFLRRRGRPEAYLLRIFENGMMLSQSDFYRGLRCIEYYWDGLMGLDSNGALDKTELFKGLKVITATLRDALISRHAKEWHMKIADVVKKFEKIADLAKKLEVQTAEERLKALRDLCDDDTLIRIANAATAGQSKLQIHDTRLPKDHLLTKYFCKVLIKLKNSTDRVIQKQIDQEQIEMLAALQP